MIEFIGVFGFVGRAISVACADGFRIRALVRHLPESVTEPSVKYGIFYQTMDVVARQHMADAARTFSSLLDRDSLVVYVRRCLLAVHDGRLLPDWKW